MYILELQGAVGGGGLELKIFEGVRLFEPLTNIIAKILVVKSEKDDLGKKKQVNNYNKLSH